MSDDLYINGKKIPMGPDEPLSNLSYDPDSTLTNEAIEEVRGVTTENRKVWVSADSSHDVSMAKSFGEVVTVVPGKVNVFGSDSLKKQVYEVLKDSKPDEYVILAGNMLASALVYEAMMNYHGVVNVLIFSFSQNKYEVRSIREVRLEELE